ncbi:non-ribosomal peptide synthetase [Pseudoduganella violaceinigra]|uniref:non-ribosomal peptide synthetase n=1 Tax=Pseudoduganella violaceinigra TaxID=246602 RepID=UPI000417A2DC|nr:non-ribosomal peptide synthetase [Pseudoduganella violaceinigra]
MQEQLKKLLVSWVSAQMKVNAQDIDGDTTLSEYGFDSVALTGLANTIGQRLDIEITPSVFFEHPTLDGLSAYLAREYAVQLAPKFTAAVQVATPENVREEPRDIAPARRRGGYARQGQAFATLAPQTGVEPVAIIGISGQFPMARDVNEFWRNLSEGKDCISEIPSARWDASKTDIKWGGFIDGVDQFDPKFFGISPKEAELMDPQQRLAMMHVWKALEDAGYSGHALAGSDTAIFIGTGPTGYGNLLNQAGLGGEAYTSTGSVPSVGANRLSYMFDWHGPSEPVETACSSSLVAIRRGVLAIQSGESCVAVVGGVNTIVTPEAHISFSKAGMLCKDGRCKTFSDQANGYVRAEGAGMLVLKKLSAAERDGDHIYAVVRGTAENHGGRANSLTAPNSRAQAELLIAAYRQAGIDPRTVGYIEAHGTGTALGDPVEVTALKSAFKALYAGSGSGDTAAHCGLGSVKSNIGHLELAAGVAGVIKVLLQMKHKTLAKSLHCETLNPYIDLSASPFYVVQQAAPWNALQDASGRDLPRRAGVSSFGFGGVNAHVVLEEYIAPAPAVPPAGPAMVVLSARNPERLQEQVQLLLEALQPGRIDPTMRLADLAFTLQTGREPMEERLAMVADSLDDLRSRLAAYLRGDTNAIYRGQHKRGKDAIASFGADEDLAQTIEAWLNKGKFDKVLELWVKGLAFDWKTLYQHGAKPRRVSLPSYPFARERYWVPDQARQALPASLLHPLLHRNTSDFSAQRFSSRFSGKEFFLADHMVHGVPMLPGVAQLEMAYSAAAAALGSSGSLVLRRINWARPAKVSEGGLDLHIALLPQNDGSIAFEIYSEAGEAMLVHSQGEVLPLPEAGAHARHNLAELREQCGKAQLDAEQCYAAFAEMGLQYGVSFRGLTLLLAGQDIALAQIQLPSAAPAGDFVLHPALLDAALQATLGLQVSQDGAALGTGLLLPFGLEALEVCAPLAPTMWALVRRSAGSSADDAVQKIDIDLCDEDGTVCLRFKQFSVRAVGAPAARPVVAPRPAAVQPASDALREQSILQFKKLIGGAIKVAVADIDATVSFDQYGIDSILVMELTGALREVFGNDSDISTTIFFEYQSIEELVDHFLRTDRAALVRWTGLGSAPAHIPAAPQEASPERADEPKLIAKIASARRFLATAVPAPSQASVNSAPFDVAIIGLSGRYPQADDVNQFWENLLDGRNCISEIPAERWDSAKVYDARRNQPGKSYSKWAGLLNDVAGFDHLFFNITPREAQMISPQERLFLQEAYASIEDAGYTPAGLCPSRKVGVFVGVTHEYYATGSRFWSIANRASYLFNFQGPSMAVDTACSSSLTAVHMAIESLRCGSSDVAVAGGVNLILAPGHMADLSELTLLSGGDKCKAFAADGDGFVDGEAVGALVLKPLQKAIADGDHIYGVIKGSAVNSGGKTNGFLVPGPNAQARVVQDALERAGVDARCVSYLEAQGTGSNLGDPIEIAGLNKAFRNWTGDQQFCAIGTAKSNVGHCESASGFVGISKVLMQMKHATLVPSLHAAKLNPQIDFAASPFVVQQAASPWARPVLEIGGRQREYPRIAGVSSFGAGGSNAHVVIEEYIAPVRESSLVGPALIVLSARDEEGLQRQADRLLDAIAPERGAALPALGDLAFTLQTGREAMEERLALLADSIGDLRQILQAFANGQSAPDGVYRGQAKRSALAALADDEDMSLTVQAWITKGKYGKLLDLWVKGFTFDWHALYSADGASKPRRISLPTYPFSRHRFWTDVRYPEQPELAAALRGNQVLASPQDSVAVAPAGTALDGEQAMLAVWRAFFGRPTLQADDNYFDLGGDSLLATQLVTRIGLDLGLELPVNAVFEAPTAASLQAWAVARGLVSTISAPARSVIPRSPRTAGTPLSFAQQRLWFLDQMGSHNALYNVAGAVRMCGTLDHAALLRTLNTVVQRHEALRTTFVMADGKPVQAIAAQLDLSLAVTDLSGLPPSEREARAKWLLQDEAQAPFDLATGPLIRAGLLRLGAQEHILLVTIHHIVSDGWSMGVLVREVGVLYAAYVQGGSSPLPPLPIQYADFAEWQRHWLSGAVLGRQLDYWRERLAGSVELLNLPTDRPRPAAATHVGASMPFSIPAALTAKLRKLSRGKDASLFMTLCAAFNVLLARYSGQNDVCIGTPIANRNHAGLEGLIGFFVNTLVLRTQVDLEQSFNALLEQVRGHTLEAYAHQDVPFEHLVETLQPKRHASYTPLFQVMLVLHNTPMGELVLPGLAMTQLESEGVSSKFDLSLVLREGEGALAGCIEYATDLFDAATIARMAEHFTRLLQAVADDPARALDTLPLLGEAERQQLIHGWNDGARANPAHASTISQLFEQRAERHPGSLALTCGGSSMSYGELNQRANQLGHQLRALGVGPDVLVGVCAERSLEMVVALLGVLKAGGAYLPLDPAYPAERLAHMLSDAQPAVLLAQDHLVGRLSTGGIDVVSLNLQKTSLARYSTQNPQQAAGAEHLAYVVYTSGSTGRPKGVPATHRNVLSLVIDASYCALDESDSVLQFAPLSFDAATFEIWGALLNGARLEIFPAAFESLQQLASVLERSSVTTLWLTAAMFNQMVDHHPASLAKLRHVLAGGEALSMAHVKRFVQASAGQVRLTNGYGPTENTTFSCCHDIGDDALRLGSIPIGRAIAGRQAYVLDTKLEPVPVGVAGELYLAGDGLARGYLNRPDLTAEKFLPCPYAEQAGARMYRSGDLVRRLADGSIEFLGRIDHQVKIRGFRIELGEVEAALTELPYVREAAVLAREDDNGGKRLVAYLVGQPGQAIPDTADLRAILLRALPEYMAPRHFVVLEALPLTPNGKIDRSALPLPAMGGDAEGYVAPRTPDEEKMARIWAEVLQLGQVGVHDNFFDLGGHSLLATQLVQRVNAGFQVEATLHGVFAAPTVAELLAQILPAQAAAASPAPQSAAATVCADGPGDPAAAPLGESYPVSFSQQRLWLVDQVGGSSALYNIPVAVRMSGKLDRAALQAALNDIVQRHDTLRVCFDSIDGTPVQRILPQLNIVLGAADLRALPPQEREERAHELLMDEIKQPFNLQTGPLIRASLVQKGELDYLLLMTMHHIASDGWSMGILVREMGMLYAAHAYGAPAALAPLPMRYVDFAQWQRQWLSGDVLERQLNYWKRQLADGPTLLTLPTDRPRPAAQSHAGAAQSYAIPAKLVARLQALSRQAHSTLFMTLAAAFNVLLARYANQSDICIGTPIANRNNADIEGLIGFFVNTLVLRTQVDLKQDFNSLLKQVRDNTLDAYSHQDVPFEQLVEAVQPERHASYAPLFQVMLVLQNAPMGKLEMPGLELERMPNQGLTAKFDLTLALTEENNALSGYFEYATDLFDAGTIERMGQHLTHLLEAIAANPACPVGLLPMLADAERHMLLRGFNDTATVYPAIQGDTQTLHQLFEAQVARTPHHQAVVYEGRSLTYAELNARANQLARHLRQLGVGPDSLVGLCTERSLEMIVGLYGIHKAGGAYVPLEPSYPQDRLATIAQDAAVKAILTQQHLLENVPTVPGIPVFSLDSDASELAAYDSTNPENFTQPNNLAYVIYTSGSTGKPKGVGIDQRGIVNRLKWMQAEYLLTPADRIMQKTPFSFDVSVWEFFWPLIEGATLVVAKPGGHQDVMYLARLIDAERITTMHFVPPMLEVFLNEAEGDCGNTLRQVMCSGQALPMELQQRFFSKWQHVELHNLYGPTEASVDVTYWQCHAQSMLSCVPIGKPIANIQIHILDAEFNPVPVGVVGNLYIAGIGLARGYVNRPDLTAQTFIPNPYSAEPGARMYLSGDLARYLPDGNIEYLGRSDHQVKIRGLRIELGEIESAIAAQEAVRDTVVLARPDERGIPRLVAYLVAHGGQALPDDAALRAVLLQSLPDYMVPDYFVALDLMPLTSNGKVDRKALPAPDMSREEAVYVAPRNRREETMAGIWADILSLEKVSVEDDFFALGGHSLLATQLMSRIKKTFQIELPLRDLFDAPTVALLCAKLPPDEEEASAAVAPPTQQQPALPLSFAQQRLWFLNEFEPGSASYNLPSVMRISGMLDAAALERALNEIVRRHEALRTSFRMGDGAPVQVIAPQLHLPLPLTDLSALPASERQARALWLTQDEAQAPFDLEAGPVLRSSLLRLAPQEHLLLLTIHHIAADGWSLGVLMREMGTLYAAFTQGQPSPLPELPIQYAEFTRRQREWLSGEVLERQLAYWARRLDGVPGLLQLPTDRPRPPMPSHRGAQVALAFPPELSARLRAFSLQKQSTPFMVLCSAFNVLLARYSGQDDICIGTPIANRNRDDIEGLIGCFVNTLVLRTQVQLGQSFSALLEQVKQNTLDAYANQDIPFEQLVERLQPERNPSYSPLFQVMLVLQNMPSGPLELPGFRIDTVPPESATAKFDLTLILAEGKNGLEGSLEYAAELFDAATIERMGRHFVRLLQAIVTDPDRPLGDLPLMREDELHRMLRQWNETDLPSLPAHGTQTMHQLVEDQVARTPQRVALMHEGRAVSYAELNGRANRLAHYLRGQGVGPDDLVGVCMERSADMVVCLLAVLKSGGAYVPLDPAYPAERVAAMLGDAQPKVLLTQEQLLAKLPVLAGVTVFCVDAQQQQLASHSDENPVNRTLGQHLAYVIYTSGSTGRPKGVAIQHLNAAVFIHWALGQFDAAWLDKMLASTSICFDLSIFEIFVPLSMGGSVWVVRNILDFAERAEQFPVTLVNSVPSAMAEVARSTTLPASVKVVNLAGEALPNALAQALYQQEPVQRVFNLYGPSEDTTYSTCALVEKGGDAAISIGKPIANTQAYIVDARLNPVPLGAAGELCIAGDGLARGYLHQPGLTAEKFIPNPFGKTRGTRMYRTGDLVRQRADGMLEYLGRIDHQVKIRGFRIELGEVETALQALAGEAVVLAREDHAGDKRLVAYLAAGEGRTVPDAELLRAGLLRTLPEYMVPSHFVTLERMPLNPNGKIDRKALPAPDMTRASAAHVEPRGAMEVQLAAIWQEVLKVEKVGATDDFFALGGHSLLAVHLISAIRRKLDAEIAVRDLFVHPSLQALAAFLDTHKHAGRHPNLVPIRPAGSQAPLFLIHPVGGEVQYAYDLARHLDASLPVYGLAASGWAQGETPRASIEAMAGAYLEAIRQVQPSGPYSLAGWSLGGMVAYEIAQRLHAAGERVRFLGMIDSGSSANLRATMTLAANGEFDQACAFLQWVSDLHPGLDIQRHTAVAQLLELGRRNELDAMIALCKREQILDSRLDDDFVRRTVAIYQAGGKAALAYEAPAPAGTVHLFSAERAPGVDATLGWRKLLGGSLQHITIGGSHATIVKPPHIEKLGKGISAALSSAAPAASTNDSRVA